MESEKDETGCRDGFFMEERKKENKSIFSNELFGCSSEIRDQERQFQEGYYANTIYAQRLEFKAMKLKIRQQESYDMSVVKLGQFGSEEDEMRRTENQKKKDYYKVLKKDEVEKTIRHEEIRDFEEVEDLAAGVPQDQMEELPMGNVPLEPDSPYSIHLPIEVWEKVFHYSRAEDAWNFRLVCKEWKKELDYHFDKWAVRLHQTSPFFQHTLQLKVKQVRILDLPSPVDSLGQGGTTGLFKRPEMLQKLTIPNDCYIRPKNLLLLLDSCAKTIKNLDIAVGAYEDVHSDPSYNLHPYGFEFPKLEHVKLVIASCPQIPIHQITLFKLILGLSTMRKINSLTVTVKDPSLNLTAATLLEFIGKNRTNLEEISCQLIPKNEGGIQFEDPVHLIAHLRIRPIDLALLKQVRSLKKIQIEDKSRFRFIPWIIVQAWANLMKVQTNLTDFIIKRIPISPRILNLICQTNEKTLCKIELGGLDFNIDLRILAYLINLEELQISSDRQNRLVLWNTQRLPTRIQKFQSKNYLIFSKDMLGFLVGHEELVEIRLTCCGFDGIYGVNAAVFAHLITNRSLSNRLREICIDGFNCSISQDKDTFNQLLRGLEDVYTKGWDLGAENADLRDVCVHFQRTVDEYGDFTDWELQSFYC